MQHDDAFSGSGPKATHSRSRRLQTIGAVGLLAMCVVGVIQSPYTRLPFAIVACAVLLAADLLMRARGWPNPVGDRGRRWLVALTLLLALAGLAFVPIPHTRPSFFVVLAASALAAAMYAIAAGRVAEA